MIWAAVYERGTIMISLFTCCCHSDRISDSSIPVLIVEWIIGKFSPMTKEISSLRLIQGALNLFCGLPEQRSL